MITNSVGNLKLFKKARVFQISTVYNTLTRKLSYVEKAKFTENLKKNKSELLEQLPLGNFLIYNGSRPLLDNTEPSRSVFKKILWTPYSELSQFSEQILNTYCLLHLDDDMKPHFTVQLNKGDQCALESLEGNKGSFFDLRLSYFSVNWRDAHILSQANSLLNFHKYNAFCGRCGSQTSRSPAGDSRKCSTCDRDIYPTSTPVGIVLITDRTKDHILLVRHLRSYSGPYTCVAGFSNVGESIEETVQREVAEEVGLEVDCVSYAASRHWPFPSTLMIGCYAEADMTTDIKINEEELKDARWFPRKEVKEAFKRTLNLSIPKLWASRKKDQQFLLPPRGAVSHGLIEHYLRGTPSQEVHKHIYQ